ncbi:MAG: GntG family PLP-dependent aldolase [Chloroflexota bacterium]|nr:GntG family PLP-dependent aldolase [Chloroflexota bacterium]MDP6756650.1 GntG family PLP-dependent aldolase [Chloroflexota bacterium]
MNGIVDMRSDTVTLPTDAMRAAMARAEVGDDVCAEDPTVNELEEYAADLFGKEAALFVTSGTQGNAVAMMAHTVPGDLVYCEARAHVGHYEAGGPAVLSGATLEKISCDRGILTADRVEAAMEPEDVHLAIPRVIWAENTSNGGGGTCMTVAEMEGLRGLADRHGLKIHVDGARIFNAAARLEVSVKELAAAADTVQFCLSKGLGAPVGSMVVSSRSFRKAAHRKRKLLGGGLRQAGVIAAAGLVALKETPPLLPLDHANAQSLAEGIAEIPGLVIDPDTVETNLVYFGYEAELIDAVRFVDQLSERGYLIGEARKGISRACTHHQVSADDVGGVLAAMREVAATAAPA